MSDGAAPLAAESAPVAESAPTSSPGQTSTQTIAANVIQSAEHAAEQAETQAETRLDTRNTPTPDPQADKPTPAELSAAAKFLLKQGHAAKKVDGRDVWLPHGTVEKMLDRYVEEQQTSWKTERQTIEEKAKTFEQQIASLRAGVAGDPKAFLSELAQVDPRYKAFLEQQVAQAQPAAPVSEMPAPDLRLQDGSATYSLDGLKKLLEWNTAQVKSQILPVIDERFKPIAEREKAEKAKAQFEAFRSQKAQETNAKMQEATKWPGFGEFAADGSLNETQAAILAELQKDQTLSLDAAYLRIVGPKLATRESLAQQINAAPKAPAMSRQSTDAPKAQKSQSTRDVAARVIATLEKNG